MEPNNNKYTPPVARVADPEPEMLTERPRQISTAVWLLWISFAIGSLNRDLIYPLIIGTHSLSLIATVIGSSITILVTIWISRKLLLGRNWMRITLLIAFAIGLLLMPFNMKMLFHGSTELLIVYVVQGVIQAISLWLLFTKPGSDWFRKKSS